MNPPAPKEQLAKAAFPGVEAFLSSCTINGTVTNNIIFTFSGIRRILSTRDGFREVMAVAENCCPETLWDYVHRNPEKFRETIMESYGRMAQECAFLYTGASLENGVIKAADDKAMVFVTTDVRTNAHRSGADVPSRKRAHQGPGTINIFLFTGDALSEGAMTRCLITITEAKCAALQDAGIKSSYSPHLTATGTGTDNIIVTPGTGEKVDILRGHSELSLHISRTVAAAVREALRRESTPMEQLAYDRE